MTRDEVTKQFDFACEKVCDLVAELKPFKHDLVMLAKHHERRNVCIDNVCHQVEIFERRNLCGYSQRRAPGMRQFAAQDNRRRRNLVIAAAAQMYMLAIKAHRDQQNLSPAQQSMLAKQGQPTGIQEQIAGIVKEAPRYDMRGAGTEVARHGVTDDGIN